jgi:hypothetical protein
MSYPVEMIFLTCLKKKTTKKLMNRQAEYLFIVTKTNDEQMVRMNNTNSENENRLACFIFTKNSFLVIILIVYI